ncbi:DUF308 domain-containing protein [Ruminococcus sp.]|uniref:DUF308 domain-containing protein n=1 Tax=Ruminococcus sp. TaxID=41978 RepID=UPI0025DE3576|nr:DUF308 domain-containing protein [Ruminococcus sp.]
MKPKSPKSKSSRRTLYVLLPFILPLCLIGMGILLLVNEGLFNKIFLSFGILIALIGLIEVVIYASRRKFEVQTQYLVTGIILMVIGAILIIVPFTVNTLIPILIGICILASGISGAVNTMTFRKENSSVLIPMIFAITNCLLGVFILIYVLFVNQNAGWNIIGILMIISGVLRMVNEVLARISVPKSSAAVVETVCTDTADKANSTEEQ